MAAKKTKKPQAQKPEQTLLSIKPLNKVEERLDVPPVEEPVKEQPTVPLSVIPKPVKRLPDVASAPTPPVEEAGEPQVPSNAIFQAVGIITGIVKFNPEGKATVAIGDKEYQLYYSPNHRKAFDALRLQAKKNPLKVERLIVYPRVMHFPSREQHYQMSFQLLGFESPQTTEGITKELEDFEFRLCGLWQFIPVCQIPCISVFKNFTGERLEYIKQAEPEKKVRFMKASHIPLIWRDSPVRPFKFNPRIEQGKQGHSSFVEVLAKFLPGGDVFGFIRMMGEPGKAPKFLKAGKKDKAEALKTKVAIAKKGTTQKKSWGKPKKKDS